eukprot:352393-Chlamydomonas_euryale.AAC.3
MADDAPQAHAFGPTAADELRKLVFKFETLMLRKDCCRSNLSPFRTPAAAPSRRTACAWSGRASLGRGGAASRARRGPASVCPHLRLPHI